MNDQQHSPVRSPDQIGLRPSLIVESFALVGLTTSLFAITSCEDQTVTRPPIKTTDPNQEPIPTDAAPEELQRLIKDGHIKLVYDSDPEFVKADTGKAHFHLIFKQTFEYSFTKSKRNGRWHVKLTATQVKPTVRLEHTIRLPVQYKSDHIWNDRLLRHEFDHVAVSLDPRPVLLIERLFQHLPAIERTLDPGQEPSDELHKKFFNEEFEKRGQAVIELVKQNNVLLDKVGKHGTVPVPRRAEFFGQLYLKENLAKSKFPYLEEVLDLLETPKYREAELRFLPRDPTEN
jgi:hypothetical protein